MLRLENDIFFAIGLGVTVPIVSYYFINASYHQKQ